MLLTFLLTPCVIQTIERCCFHRTLFYHIRMTPLPPDMYCPRFQKRKLVFLKQGAFFNMIVFLLLLASCYILISGLFFFVCLHSWHHNKFGIFARDISSVISLSWNHGSPGFHSFAQSQNLSKGETIIHKATRKNRGLSAWGFCFRTFECCLSKDTWDQAKRIKNHMEELDSWETECLHSKIWWYSPFVFDRSRRTTP